MTILHNILSAHDSTKIATDIGTKMHARLQHTDSTSSTDLAERMFTNPTLRRLFDSASQTEVPIAGIINGRFISRRIDRIRINHTDKIIEILDYKTDIAPENYRTKYILQIREYANLVHKLYPDYKIICYILWTHDFSLEQIN